MARRARLLDFAELDALADLAEQAERIGAPAEAAKMRKRITELVGGKTR